MWTRDQPFYLGTNLKQKWKADRKANNICKYILSEKQRELDINCMSDKKNILGEIQFIRLHIGELTDWTYYCLTS